MNLHISYLASQLPVRKPPFTIYSLLHAATEALSDRLSTGVWDGRATPLLQIFSFKFIIDTIYQNFNESQDILVY